MASIKDTNINDSGFLKLPVGTTAERPASPNDGYMRYNTTENFVEYFKNGNWYEINDTVAASATGATYTSTIVENGVKYRVHTFYGTGSLTVTRPGEVEYLLVGGGGGGGAWVGGGGGAGGFLQGRTVLTPGTYPITVGAGGNAEYNPGSYTGMPRGTNGGNTTAFGLTAFGGGRGGSWSDYDALAGGSGGGEGHSPAGAAGTPGQGYPGGQGRGQSTNGYPTGGGGGAGGPGGSWTTTKSGDGGPGRSSRITGDIVWYAGGGGGGIHGNNANAQPGNGGIGGGGYGDAPNTDDSIGSPDTSTTGSLIWDSTKRPTGRRGSEFTGGGGGASGRSGGRASEGGAGGSGIAVVRYKINETVDVLPQETYGGNDRVVSLEGLVFAFDAARPKNFSDHEWDNKYIYSERGHMGTGNIVFSNFPEHSGRGNGAVWLDNNAYLTVPYNAETMDFRLGQTILAWMRPKDSTGRRNLYDQAYGGSGTWTHEPNGNMSWYFGTNGGNASPYVGRGSPFQIGTEETAFVCCTRDQTRNETKWYKNGVLEGTGDAGSYAATVNSGANIRIGLGYAGYWRGHLHMMMVFNRPLSEIEVKRIYDTTKHRFGMS
jgi:hypothetical protein